MSKQEIAKVEKILLNKAQEGRRNIYTNKVRDYYYQIIDFKNRGFTFTQICNAFKEAGILPEKAKIDSFRKAFLKEYKRNNEPTN